LRGDSQALATLRSFVIRHVWKNFFRHGYRKYEFPHDQGQNHKWGTTSVSRGLNQTIYPFVLDSGEAIIVHLKNGEVEAIVFWPTCDLSLPSRVKTTKGIGIGDPFEKVRIAYGDLHLERGGGLEFYSSTGIAFIQAQAIVGAIIVFQPGKFPERSR